MFKNNLHETNQCSLPESVIEMLHYYINLLDHSPISAVKK
jgi:hypothetical protein